MLKSVHRLVNAPLRAQARVVQQHRLFSSEPEKSIDEIGNEKVRQLADNISNLTVLEASWLSEILRKKLNIPKPSFGSMPMMASPIAAAPAAAAPTAAAAAPVEEKKEKTEFDIKLESFSADGKIKIIKEIRAITSLGLKEAKELVEKAPIVIKGNVPKAEAEELKKQLEAAGAKISLD
uniref:Ribosomal protein L7/L12 C-terminal domain-containing protein n=1 Tax=Polytomella parva TaxID=51329 RepID=A0A7S0URM6_9CHLO|mmetsp:Transcript_1891/g.2796  ORF Transcript_1891/g.2796 Transcript_1891/m.2796 type:complete len:179 (+) Transcript_1891:110-646(+)|eukprot:CAMPEP_0175061038 /NCGR_PEP_ID=MMETSP0052_2-20121109/13367_1 /TAXON_ID=51329 ORGANISM="Polytomella parva, Strain SAG 63-3" /NCGR_SAMPLE_ID=MMETSP0052_2 /ASSEMBLY_ACC=CAM_ASM_000194 /LENGTH=178 /DNA_ID=CAMNT_0016326857 /DNA_START=84 /DNA_END=620 /DNA_ORIENTATION=+